MKEALSTPSPSRFWRKLGILNAALYASAASEVPRKCPKTLWRTSPASRLSRIPAATTDAPPLRPFPRTGAAGVAATGGAFCSLTRARIPPVPGRRFFFDRLAAPQPMGEHFTGELEAVLFSKWQSPTFWFGSTTARTGAVAFCGGADQGTVTFSLPPGCKVLL